MLLNTLINEEQDFINGDCSHYYGEDAIYHMSNELNEMSNDFTEYLIGEETKIKLSEEFNLPLSEEAEKENVVKRIINKLRAWLKKLKDKVTGFFKKIKENRKTVEKGTKSLADKLDKAILYVNLPEFNTNINSSLGELEKIARDKVSDIVSMAMQVEKEDNVNMSKLDEIDAKFVEYKAAVKQKFTENASTNILYKNKESKKIEFDNATDLNSFIDEQIKLLKSIDEKPFSTFIDSMDKYAKELESNKFGELKSAAMSLIAQNIMSITGSFSSDVTFVVQAATHHIQYLQSSKVKNSKI